ncbi:Mur ligase domain-containing protein [Thermomonas sp. S9]|nr:Mur ligase domain-containing protein [Thermomonas sp. S9]
MSAEHVRRMLLGELLPELEGLSAELAITGLVQDSREVRPGDAFVAIGGFGAHGLHFADAAKAAGAAAVLYEPPAPDDLPAPADAIPVPGLRARWARWPTPSTAIPARQWPPSASPVPTARPRPCSC